MRTLIGAFFALALLACGNARADMTWDVRAETVMRVGAETRELPTVDTTFSLKANVLRIDSGREQPVKFINAHNHTVVMLSYATETFLFMDFGRMVTTMNAEREQVRAQVAQAEQRLASLPPEQRAEQLALVEGQKRKFELWSRPYSVRATGERAEIDGHPCLRFEGRAGDEVFQEIWVAEDITPEPSYRLQVSGLLAQLNPHSYSFMTRVPGLAVKVITHYGPVTVTERMTSYTSAPIPADAFIIPENFRETAAAMKRNQ